jgi:hypothetical protein
VKRRLDTCAIAVLLIAIALPARGQDVRRDAEPKTVAGRGLADILQSLQARGLRIVFSSNIVTPDMRIRAEPRAATPRDQLDEILAPHGLVVREGPGGVLQVVRAPHGRAPGASSTAPREQEETSTIPELLPVYNERITVMSPWPWWEPVSGVVETFVNRQELTAMPAGLVDDPIKAIHSMPRVAPVDDYRSEFVVRASPFRHAEVVVDGVSTPWLRHAPAESGSVSMFTTRLLQSATLRAGAYARTYGDRLGPQLELTLREGSRDRVHVSGTVANTAAAVVAEGPIGEARGSWIAAARQSLLEWPGEDLGSAVQVFGFSDALGKLVLDVNSHHQLGFSLLAGRSRVDADEPDDDVESSPAIQPAARTSVANLSWRSAIGSTTVLTQRAYLIRQEIVSERQIPAAGPSLGASEEMVYRAAVVSKMPLGVLQTGAQLGRTTWDGRESSASAWTRAGYLNLQARAGSRLTIVPGIRASGASHVSGAAVSPWLLGELAIGRWTLAASTGASHQFPEVGRAYQFTAAGRLQPERALHADVSLRHQLTTDVRWEATLYQRREQGILDRGDDQLTGSARGFELIVERRSTNGLSGWGAYTYGRTRHADAERRETFWADFDQRHAVAAFGTYRWPDATTIGATLRIGTGVPIPGYLSYRGNDLFVGERRNEVRLSTYSRFDVRVDRPFQVGGRRLHAFVEVVNLFDRSNTAAARGTFGLGGEAIGFVEPLTPRRASAGVTFGF